MPLISQHPLGFPVLLAVVMIAMVLLTALLLRTRARRCRAKAPSTDALYLGTDRIHGAHLRIASDPEVPAHSTLHAVFPIHASLLRTLTEVRATPAAMEVTVILDGMTYRMHAPIAAMNVVSHPERKGTTRYATVVFGPAPFTLVVP